MSKDLRARELAAIHIRRKERGLDEDAYRSLLREVAGVSSARDLDAAGRRAVLDRLGNTQRPLERKVFALLGGRGERYALGILRQMESGRAPARLRWASNDQLRRVVQALEYDRRRHPAHVSGQ